MVIRYNLEAGECSVDKNIKKIDNYDVKVDWGH